MSRRSWLLATLAVMNVCAGIELVLTENTVVSATSPLLDLISTKTPLGISVYVWTLAIGALLFIIGVQHTPAGLRLYAAGAYPDVPAAAAAMGRVQKAVYTPDPVYPAGQRGQHRHQHRR